MREEEVGRRFNYNRAMPHVSPILSLPQHSVNAFLSPFIMRLFMFRSRFAPSLRSSPPSRTHDTRSPALSLSLHHYHSHPSVSASLYLLLLLACLPTHSLSLLLYWIFSLSHFLHHVCFRVGNLTTTNIRERLNARTKTSIERSPEQLRFISLYTLLLEE